MDTEHLLNEIRSKDIMSKLNIQSQSGQDAFCAQFSRWSTSLGRLRSRQVAWNNLAEGDSAWMTRVPALLDNERILREYDPTEAGDSQEENWSQILFSGEFSSLNYVPYLLAYVALSKIIIAPLLSWMMPIFSIVLPFLALKFVYGLPIKWGDYWETMKPMIGLSGNKPLSVSSLLQWGSMLVSYAHGMYIPYKNATHCYHIHEKMVKVAEAVKSVLRDLKLIGDAWKQAGLRVSWVLDASITEESDARQICAWLMEDKNYLIHLYRAIGTVEVVHSVLNCTALRPVEWVESITPFCRMEGAVDGLLEPEKRVPFSLVLGPSNGHHVVVTGPNRGGKSTFLRSVLSNLMLAQSWGVAFAERCVLTPVEWVISSLRLEDRPGQQSLFEREVSVAGEILRRARTNKGRGWVIIDELFHTTNPPDAATASQIFLRQLWETESTSSLISTHLFAHAETAPNNVQRLCVASEEDLEQNGKILYSYEVTQGINTMSSVRELLVEADILLPGADFVAFKTLPNELEEDQC